MEESNQLLGAYAEHGDEAAFYELVKRYTRLVYSAALRHVNDPHAAEDITQQVFAHLAEKARRLSPQVVIGGWLYRDAVYTASKYRRSMLRRMRREEEAGRMNEETVAVEDSAWDEVAPIIDEALKQLAGRDRDAIVLRYFEGQALRTVGNALGITEDAARMRIERALEKLKRFVVSRGVTVSTAALVTLLSTHSTSAAPVIPTDSIASNALNCAGSRSGSDWVAPGWAGSKGFYVMATGAVLVCLITALVWRSMGTAKTPGTLAAMQQGDPASVEIRGGIRRTTSNPTAMSFFVFKPIVLRSGEQGTVTNTRGQYRVTMRPRIEANSVRLEAFLLEDAAGARAVLFPAVNATNGEQIISAAGIYTLEVRPTFISRK